MKNRQITIYQLKKNFSEQTILSKGATKIESKIPNVDIYTKTTPSHTNNLVKQFFGSIIGDEQLQSSSFGILIIYKNINGFDFAITFGTGRHILCQDDLIRDFGIKTAMNIIDPENIKNLNKITLDTNPLNSKIQRSITTGSNGFDIDGEFDLAKKISGKIAEKYSEKLGKIADGGVSLTLRPSCDAESIIDVLKIISDISRKEDYKRNFPWFENSKKIEDKSKISKLNDILIKTINAEKDGQECKIWASIPEYIDTEDLDGYKIDGTENEATFNITKEEILDAIKPPITIEKLRAKKIIAISSNGGYPINKWRAYNCFYMEITKGDVIFLLVDGDWFEVKQELSKKINSEYAKLSVEKRELPVCDCEKYPKEADYNKMLSQRKGAILMDSACISHGGGYGRVEVCDVMTDSEYIHTKIYGGSSVLSHLFNQGYVSAVLLKSDKEFLSKVEKKFASKIGNPTARKVLFAIITEKVDKFDIPFFSKITLCHIARDLEAYGYEVKISLIEQINKPTVKSHDIKNK